MQKIKKGDDIIVITGKDKNRSVTSNGDSDKYNYEPDFKKNNESNKLKFFEIFKQSKIYTYDSKFFSIPISRNIDLLLSSIFPFCKTMYLFF